MSIVLLGGSGLLGSAFAQIFKEKNIPYYAPPHSELDITNLQKVQNFFHTQKPEKIILCAAYTDVEKAENDQEKCELLNIESVKNILTLNIPFIHFSTDYVFNVPKGLEIPENYQKNPLNFYGTTKARAEELLEASSSMPWWNIRTSWLFGPYKDNFVTKILALSQTQDRLEVVDDQVGRPTFTLDLATYILEHFILQDQPTGHYHLQNTGNPISWAGLAEYILRKKSWTGTINKITTAISDRTAQRPQNSIFKNTKLPDNLRDWKKAVDEFLLL